MTIHKYHVNNKYVCYLIIFTLTFLTSCSDKEDTTSEKDSNQLRVRVSVGIDNYMGEATRGSGKQWENNDRIYVHSSAFSGVLTYDGSNWTISYKGDVSGNSNCELYYFENVTGQDGSNVSLDYKSAVYHDQNASMKNLGDEIIFLGHLAPNCSRIRIKAADGTKIKVSGLKVFSGYSLSTNECATKSMEELQFVTQNGYTPYIYLPSNGNNQEMIIKTIGNVYKRTLTDTQHVYGRSGYFQNPTKENLNGWEFVSEEPIEKWDGNIASSFAGGSGTMTDPYKIETGGQLLLMKNYSDKYFKLIANIDLDNKNWLPFEFSGQLDGCGFTIHNLYINRESDYLGLFSKVKNVIKNVSIKKIVINTPQHNCIGSLCGAVGYGARIINCHAIFENNSIIVGDSHVGGLIGEIGTSEVSVSNCSVFCNDSVVSIIGNSRVGGVAGLALYDTMIERCDVNANLNAEGYVGGIVGYAESKYDSEGIINCSYKGLISGGSYVGGIVGYGAVKLKIIACKADASIYVTDGNAGGILGYSGNLNAFNVSVIGCYSTGNIKPDGNQKKTNIGGIVGYCRHYTKDYTSIILSYSCMTSYSDSFSGVTSTTAIGVYSSCSISSSQNGKGQCYDITQYLHDAYMTEYDKYWNYNNTWTWEGEVNGEKVKVSCPKLYWEE